MNKKDVINYKKDNQINNFMKKIICKIKDEYLNEDIKNELMFPIYNEIYYKIFPYLLSFFILLISIITLLICILLICINK